MMSAYAIPEARLDKWKAGIVAATDVLQTGVPRSLSFGVYVNDAGTEATRIHAPPDSESLEELLETALTGLSAGVRLVQTERAPGRQHGMRRMS